MVDRDEIAYREGDKIHAHTPLAKLEQAIGAAFFDQLEKDEDGRVVLDKNQARVLVRDMTIYAEDSPQEFDARLLARLQQLLDEWPAG
jgi:hypothetical protein